MFVFQLALALGKTVRDIETNMGADELAEWLYLSTEVMPLPNPWLQTGVICATTANTSGNIRKAVDPRMFMPLPKAKRRVTWQETKHKMMAYANRHKD